MKKSNTIKDITYSGLIVALIVVLSQLMRIQIIPRTSVPLFLIPIFFAPYVLNWKYCGIVGFSGHFINDLFMGWISPSGLLWNLITGLIAIIIYLTKNYKWFIALPLILLGNYCYIIVDAISLWGGFNPMANDQGSLATNIIGQWILGIIATNTPSIIAFYFMGKKIGKRIEKAVR